MVINDMKIFRASVFIFLFIIKNTISYAESIDISDTSGGFVASDLSFVSFGPAINEAVLSEDPSFGVTYLSNDPFLGDPGINVPSDILSLSFDYNFSTTGKDTFEVNLLDQSGGAQLFSFIFDNNITGPGSFSGQDISIDLFSLGVSGGIVGLEFIIYSNIGDFSKDAKLHISDVRLNKNPVNISEPPVLLLILFVISIFIQRLVIPHHLWR